VAITCARGLPNGYRPPACSGYVPKSRDVRGIDRSVKITPEASSPMNKGPPRFAT
jgi:hypothetical protein